MICPNCGNTIEEGSLFCENCSHEIKIVPDYDSQIEQKINETMSTITDELSREARKQRELERREQILEESSAERSRSSSGGPQKENARCLLRLRFFCVRQEQLPFTSTTGYTPPLIMSDAHMTALPPEITRKPRN